MVTVVWREKNTLNSLVKKTQIAWIFTEHCCFFHPHFRQKKVSLIDPKYKYKANFQYNETKSISVSSKKCTVRIEFSYKPFLIVKEGYLQTVNKKLSTIRDLM